MNQFGSALSGDRAEKAGNPIANGWRGGFDAWTGDWKERALSHHFIKRNYMSMRCCDQCNAVKPLKRTPQNLHYLMFTDFRPNAPWTQTLRDHGTYLAETPLAQRSPWLGVPGFDINRVKFEVAHTILLGIAKDVVGSILLDFAN